MRFISLAAVKEEPESDHEEIGSLESMDISPEPMATVDQKSAIVCQVHFSKKLAQKKRVMSYLEPSIKRISSHTKKKPKGPRGPPRMFLHHSMRLWAKMVFVEPYHYTVTTFTIY